MTSAFNLWTVNIITFSGKLYISVCLIKRNPGRFGPGSFRPGWFRPNFEVCRFSLGRWVDSALGLVGFGDRMDKCGGSSRGGGSGRLCTKKRSFCEN